MVFMASYAIEGTRGENPIIYMNIRSYTPHQILKTCQILPDIESFRISGQARQEIQQKIGYSERSTRQIYVCTLVPYSPNSALWVVMVENAWINNNFSTLNACFTKLYDHCALWITTFAWICPIAIHGPSLINMYFRLSSSESKSRLRIYP